MKTRRKILASLFMAISAFAAYGQNKRVISGSVTDALTNEPLAFATVALKKQLIGIVANEEGKFDLYIPEELATDTLMISYFGYKPQVMEINAIKSALDVKLHSDAVLLEEVVIKALPPEQYIAMAVRKLKQNYPKDPFMSVAYYREKNLENNLLIKCDEGVFKTYYPNYLDTVRNQNQLMLFRTAENPSEVTFMSRERKKLENDTAKEKNVEVDVGSQFGGPDNILKSCDITKDPGNYLDTLQFKSYRYSFAKSSTYNNSEIMVIDFETKGKVDYIKENGKIYIDKASLAIVKIENKGDFFIPGFIKPIFFLIGLKFGDPKYERNIEYQQVNNKWYPKNIQYNIDIKLKKRHMFRKDDRSLFQIEQFLAVNKLEVEKALPIDTAKIFVKKKEMKEQVYNDENLSWEGLNIIKK